MKTVAFLTLLIPILIVLGVVGIAAFAMYKYRYRTARSNQALIITGPKLGNEGVFTDESGRSLKIIRGGGHLLKMNQTATPVDLTSFQLKIRTPKVYTEGGVPIIADAVATVTVAGTLEGISIFAEQFLGKKQEEMEAEVSEVLAANIRAILSKLTIEDINGNLQSFNEQVTEIAQRQLDQMGFKITSLGLTDLRDADPKNGYLENMGRPLIAQAKKVAENAEAESDKETRIQKANAEKTAREEEISRQTEIAEFQKEKDLKDAVILEQTERARAKAEQSYELEKTILSKRIQEEDLKILATRKEEELRIQQLERERQVKLEEEQSKIRKAKADSDYYETTRVAEAEAKKAETHGLTQAKIQRETGLAEAEVISRKGIAEAESKRLLAEAISEHGEVVIIEKLIEMLPLYAEKIAAPLANIDSVKIIDTGNGDGVSSFSKGITKTLVEMQEPLKEMTGIDVSQMLRDLVNRGNTHTQTLVTPGTVIDSVEAQTSTTNQSVAPMDTDIEKVTE